MAGHHLFVDPGVILREELELIVPKPVGPAVADMGDRRGLPVQQEADHGGAHPLQVAVLADGVQDVVVRDPDRGPQPVGVPLQPGVVDHRPGPVVIGARPHELQDRRHGDARGDLAVAVPPHAVGDDEDLQGGVDMEAILVVGAHHTDIREPHRLRTQPQPPFLKVPGLPFLDDRLSSSRASRIAASSPPQTNA